MSSTYLAKEKVYKLELTLEPLEAQAFDVFCHSAKLENIQNICSKDGSFTADEIKKIKTVLYMLCGEYLTASLVRQRGTS